MGVLVAEHKVALLVGVFEVLRLYRFIEVVLIDRSKPSVVCQALLPVRLLMSRVFVVVSFESCLPRLEL